MDMLETDYGKTSDRLRKDYKLKTDYGQTTTNRLRTYNGRTTDRVQAD